MKSHFTIDQKFKWSNLSHHRNRLTNKYEPLQPYLLAELAKCFEANTFIDVGANIGFYSIFLADEIKAASVLAFEPMPAPFAELRRNIELNDLVQNIQAFQVAISNERGSAEMEVISELSGANALASSTIHNGKTHTRLESVQTAPLSDFAKRSKSIAMKIDVEGHERQVISGARSVLAESQCIIQIEDYQNEVAADLSRIGYKKILSAGPDHYFSNQREADAMARKAFEAAATRFIEDHKAKPAHSHNGKIRRKVFSGVTLEFSQGFSNKVRRLVGR
jgi:FkbM family methyltransferase